MRLLVYYIIIILCIAFIGVFFVSQYSRHVQIGYDLNRLRHQRDTLRDTGRKLDYAITQAAGLDSLVERGKQMGLSLRPPIPDRPTR